MGNSEKWKGEITRSFIKNLNKRIGYHSGMLKKNLHFQRVWILMLLLIN